MYGTTHIVHDADVDYRDASEVWLHWHTTTVRIMREDVERFLKEFNRMDLQDDLLKAVFRFCPSGADRDLIETFIEFATET